MGKSRMSCFRIMSCVRDRGDEDEPGRPEVKSPVNKHRWSFKRRSSRHHVPDDCVISEPIPITISRKDTPPADQESSNLPKNSDIQERLTVAKCLEDTPPLSPPLIDADVSDSLPTAEDNRTSDSSVPESVAIVIQSAVRAYLANRDFEKRKSVVKLQAAVRGHLTRRQAVGTLRCVQAIVKMQALVRARHMRLNSENLANSVTDDEVKQDRRFDSMETDSLSAKQKKYSSMEISLRNGFARLLLESKPKTKPIYISCDHLRSDSSWKWLERWMAAGSTKYLEKEEEQNDGTSCPTEGSNLDSLVTSCVLCESSTDVASCSTVSKSNFPNSDGEVKALPDGNVDPIGNSKSQLEKSAGTAVKVEPKSHSSVEFFNGEVSCQTEKKLTKDIADSNSSEITVSPDPVLSSAQKLEGKTEMIASELLQNDQKPVQELRRSSALDFAVAISDFKELPVVSSSPIETSMSHESTSQNFISACRTEILVTSTCYSQRESPDEVRESPDEVRESATESLGRKDYLIGDTTIACNIESTMESGACALIPEGIEEQKLQANDEKHDNEVFSVTNKQRREPPEETTDSIFVTEQQAFMSSSPDTSPRSYSTATESLETSSSQVSTNARVTKKEGRLPKRKQKTKLGSKKLPANRNNELKGKNASHPLSNDPKDGKEDSSSMTDEVDETGYGPRTSVSNSLPRYMHTTESSRAKIHSSNSPRPSSDENDKDKYTRTRLSSPSDSKSQDSSSNTPIAASQARRSLKYNATQSAQKLAERRWVR